MYHWLRQFITKCDRYYYKIQQLFYYKMRQKFITKYVRFFITKCDSYYKMRRLLHIATVHTSVILFWMTQFYDKKCTFKTLNFFPEFNIRFPCKGQKSAVVTMGIIMEFFYDENFQQSFKRIDLSMRRECKGKWNSER